MADFNDYSDLSGTAISTKVAVPPEQEYFHSVYISGKSRKNHINVVERAGSLQVRGVEYNLDQVHMIITHVKTILVKNISVNNKESIDCTSYQTGQWPWYGSKKTSDGKQRMCGKNSSERAADPFCKDCKSQIIVAGIYCDENGIPKKNQEGKSPVFTFLRAKGMKYSNISEYLSEFAKLDLEPIFKPSTEESLKFEKGVVNNKRFVTKIGIGTASSQYGDKEVFTLERGVELSESAVLKILEVSKKTLDKFNEKFDWSKQSTSTSGYAAEETHTEDQVFNEPDKAVTPQPKTEVASKPSGDTFSFEDVVF